jgi:hypothetical protein
MLASRAVLEGEFDASISTVTVWCVRRGDGHERSRTLG